MDSGQVWQWPAAPGWFDKSSVNLRNEHILHIIYIVHIVQHYDFPRRFLGFQDRLDCIDNCILLKADAVSFESGIPSEKGRCYCQFEWNQLYEPREGWMTFAVDDSFISAEIGEMC